MSRLSTWLSEGNVFILDLVQHEVPFFAVASGTTISCSLGNVPMFSLSFLDVYGLSPLSKYH
jgi:hypothetical protein